MKTIITKMKIPGFVSLFFQLSALKRSFQVGELQFMHPIPEKRKDDLVVKAGCLLDIYIILVFTEKEQKD